MPRAIAIETSGRVGSVALVGDDQSILARHEFPHGLRHAAQLIPELDRLVHQVGWKIQPPPPPTPGVPGEGEIIIYVSAGPGSFTGLRIGITLAKTLAFATGMEIVAVPTLRVLARNAPESAGHLIVVLDAKRQQIFTARFERQETAWIEREPAHLDRLSEMLARAPRPVTLLGEGIPYHQQFIGNDSEVIVADPASWIARAQAVAQVGAEMAALGQFADPYLLAPIYIRPPEAEEKWETQSNK